MRTQRMTLSYPGWETDKAAAEKLYVEYASPEIFLEKVHAMKNKQRLFEGDRSHPEVVVLDNTIITYEGWEEDKKMALKRHQGDCEPLEMGDFSFKCILNTMKKKQLMHTNRESISCLKELDNYWFLYLGFQADKKIAEKYFVTYDTPYVFNQKIAAMKNKQRLFYGDRSHPDIVTLDNMVLTYEGCSEDKQEAERLHTGDCCVWELGNFAFQSLLITMERKQDAHERESRNECFLPLAGMSRLSYPGWEWDLYTAKQYYLEILSPKCFKDKLQAMKNKQRLFEGDRSHPDIVALDANNFTYPGHREDEKELERMHTGDCASLSLGELTFEAFLNKMKRKEALHTQRSQIPELRELDILIPGNRRIRQKSHKALTSATKNTKEILSETNKHCVVCFETEPSHAYIPCGHLCVCKGCAKKHDAHSRGGKVRCPICRNDSLCVTRIFQ